jgi:hypothetical protein
VQIEAEFAERLEVFFGACSEAVCRVYARFEVPDAAGSLRLAGRLVGPTCAHAATLQAAYAFVDRGPGTPRLAEAVVPEPCFWTPEMPHVYRAEIELREGGRELARVARPFGIRPLGAAGQKLVYTGKGWVLRAVSLDELTNVDLSQFRDADTAMFIRNPDDALCEAASRSGVLLVAALDDAEIPAIRRFTRWPAVGFLALRRSQAVEPRQVGHNALVAQRISAGEPVSAAAWANCLIREVSPGDGSNSIAESRLPVIVHRPAGALDSVAAGRAACDRLQHELAPLGQFAGYIV